MVVAPTPPRAPMMATTRPPRAASAPTALRVISGAKCRATASRVIGLKIYSITPMPRVMWR